MNVIAIGYKRSYFMEENISLIQNAVVEALLAKRALDVATMDVSKVTPIADSFVIATGNSDVHMNALVNAATDCLDQHHCDYKVEGALSTQWTLIDAGDLIIHVFSVKAREFYKLERILSLIHI